PGHAGFGAEAKFWFRASAANRGRENRWNRHDQATDCLAPAAEHRLFSLCCAAEFYSVEVTVAGGEAAGWKPAGRTGRNAYVPIGRDRHKDFSDEVSED